jgi:hypothetical protein
VKPNWLRSQTPARMGRACFARSEHLAQARGALLPRCTEPDPVSRSGGSSAIPEGRSEVKWARRTREGYARRRAARPRSGAQWGGAPRTSPASRVRAARLLTTPACRKARSERMDRSVGHSPGRSADLSGQATAAWASSSARSSRRRGTSCRKRSVAPRPAAYVRVPTRSSRRSARDHPSVPALRLRAPGAESSGQARTWVARVRAFQDLEEHPGASRLSILEARTVAVKLVHFRSRWRHLADKYRLLRAFSRPSEPSARRDFRPAARQPARE